MHQRHQLAHLALPQLFGSIARDVPIQFVPNERIDQHSSLSCEVQHALDAVRRSAFAVQMRNKTGT
jgi:hypothetical protein